MKIWRTTYREFEERFGGLKRLTINRKDGNLVHYTDSIVPIRYRMNVCYKPKKNCTYVSLSCLGYLDIFGPSADDPTIVCRFDGKITSDDLISKDFAYRDGLDAALDELEMDWRRKMNSIKD